MQLITLSEKKGKYILTLWYFELHIIVNIFIFIIVIVTVTSYFHPLLHSHI